MLKPKPKRSPDPVAAFVSAACLDDPTPPTGDSKTAKDGEWRRVSLLVPQVMLADIDALAAPVLNGEADLSISLRSNSLALYRAIGLDFVSGERVIPASLLRDAVEQMQRLPRWGGEAFMNELIIQRKLRLAVVYWPNVVNVRKYTKLGRWRGMLSEISMMRDAVNVLSLGGVLRQNLALLKLVQRKQGNAKRARRQSGASFEISFLRYFLTR